MQSKFKRVLIVNPFGIGDALFVTPLIRAFKENGAEKVDLLLGSRTSALFTHNPYVDEIFEWDKTPARRLTDRWRGLLRVAGMLWKLRRNHYELMFDCSFSVAYVSLGFWLLRIPARLGFNFKKRGVFLTHEMDLSKGYQDMHVVDYYLKLAGLAGIATERRDLDLCLSDADRYSARDALIRLNLSPDQPYCIVAPGGGESWGADARLKRWPVDYFARLIERIRKSGRSCFDEVIVLGTAAEHELCARLAARFVGARIHNLCGRLPLRTAGALIERASCVMANDGGLVHMARAVGTPVVALYGPVDPAVYGPYPVSDQALAIEHSGPECRPCYQKGHMRYQADCTHVNCLRGLNPDQVFEKVRAKGFLNSFRPHLVPQ